MNQPLVSREQVTWPVLASTAERADAARNRLDLLTTANTSLTDANWRGFYWEAYMFVGAIYWCFCFFMSKYSQYLERDLNRTNLRRR